MCIARFEKETREAFLDLYTKIDSNQIQASEDAVPAVPQITATDEPPF